MASHGVIGGGRRKEPPERTPSGREGFPTLLGAFFRVPCVGFLMEGVFSGMEHYHLPPFFFAFPGFWLNGRATDSARRPVVRVSPTIAFLYGF